MLFAIFYQPQLHYKFPESTAPSWAATAPQKSWLGATSASAAGYSMLHVTHSPLDKGGLAWSFIGRGKQEIRNEFLNEPRPARGRKENMRRHLLLFPALEEPSRVPGYLYIILYISCIRRGRGRGAAIQRPWDAFRTINCYLIKTLGCWSLCILKQHSIILYQTATLYQALGLILGS